VILLLLPTCARGTRDARFAVEHELEHAGIDRHYRILIPDGPAPSVGRPLLLAFHGGGGNDAQFETGSGLDDVALRENFVVVYPAGTGFFSHRLLTWNAGDGCCGRAATNEVDDVGFALAVIEAAAAQTSIDRSRIYATGHSNGAMMSYRLAREASETIAAIAPVGGAARSSGLDAARPVAVLHIHSVDDPRALYAGGIGPPFPLTRKRVDHHPVESELARWRTRDGCAEQSTEVVRRESPDGHTAVHVSWAPCSSGFAVELWRLTGAGHGWPGGVSGLSEATIGPDTDVIDAAQEVWRFVSRFRRPN
jgi:polyhydroxybutyrate depolymerase